MCLTLCHWTRHQCVQPGNTLTLSVSWARSMLDSPTLRQALLRNSSWSYGALCSCTSTCVCTPPGKGVDRSHVLIGSSCVKTNGPRPSSPSFPALKLLHKRSCKPVHSPEVRHCLQFDHGGTSSTGNVTMRTPPQEEDDLSAARRVTRGWLSCWLGNAITAGTAGKLLVSSLKASDCEYFTLHSFPSSALPF